MRLRLVLARQMTALWMAKLVEQLKFSLTISGAKVQSSSSRTSSPDIDHILDILEEESLLTLAEGQHGQVGGVRGVDMATVIVNLNCKNCKLEAINWSQIKHV